jgi:hypothetical protein
MQVLLCSREDKIGTVETGLINYCQQGCYWLPTCVLLPLLLLLLLPFLQPLLAACLLL